MNELEDILKQIPKKVIASFSSKEEDYQLDKTNLEISSELD